MNSRGLALSAVLLAALGGVLWWSNRDKAKGTPAPAADAPPKILTLTEGDITRLELKKKDGSLVLKKNNSGKWEIAAPKPYPADQDAMNGLLSAAASVTSDRLVDDKPTSVKQFGLDAPVLEVDITLRNGSTRKLFLGDDAPGGNSTYARLEGDPRVFTVASFTRTGLMKEVKDLRDKRLLIFDPDKVSRVELTAKGGAIEFGRSKDEWQILKPKPLRADGLQVEELVRKLKDAKMDLSLSDADAAKSAVSFAGGTPVATVKVTDASGTQELQVRKKGDDYFAKSSSAEGISKIPADLGTGLDKSLDDFRNKKVFDFGFNEPTKIEIHDGSKAYAFQKTGDKWTSGGKDMDNISVQALLDKLRDLAAAKFVETGPAASTLDITVTSSDGKRVEKVSIAGTLARRDGEAALYVLDPKAVLDIQKAAGDVKPAPPAKK